MLPEEQELFKKLSIADLERAQAYVKDLGQGLQIVRTFPQGVTIFGSARLPQDNKYCLKAAKLGALLAQNGHAVVTGGGPGIMEAASRGAYEIGGRVVGLNITLQHEQFPNPYLTDCLTFEYFFARKVALAMASKVFVMFPGGFGTMDELFEILCLMQENKMPKMPVFLVGKDYWHKFDRVINTMVSMKLVHKKDTQIFKITDDVNEVVKAANKVGHPKVAENFYDGFREASYVTKMDARAAAEQARIDAANAAAGVDPKAKN